MSVEKAVILDVMKKVDSFIRDLENGDIELTPEAKNLSIFETAKGRFGNTVRKDTGTYVNALGHAIADYKVNTFLQQK